MNFLFDLASGKANYYTPSTSYVICYHINNLQLQITLDVEGVVYSTWCQSKYKIHHVYKVSA